MLSSPETQFDEQVAVLTSLDLPIESIGVGGSFGKKTFDRFSDLDFFILIPSKSFFDCLKLFPTLLEPKIEIISKSEMNFFSGFGFRYSYILESGVNVDYFLNSRETLTLNPMRAKTHIIYDSNGFMTQFVKTLNEKQDLIKKELLLNSAHEFLVGSMKINKLLRRKEILPLMYRLYRIRSILISLDRYIVNSELQSHGDSDKNISKDLGEAYFAEIIETLPLSDYGAIFDAYCKMRHRIIKNFQALASEVPLPSTFYELESFLFQSISQAIEA